MHSKKLEDVCNSFVQNLLKLHATLTERSLRWFCLLVVSCYPLYHTHRRVNWHIIIDLILVLSLMIHINQVLLTSMAMIMMYNIVLMARKKFNMRWSNQIYVIVTWGRKVAGQSSREKRRLNESSVVLTETSRSK